MTALPPAQMRSMRETAMRSMRETAGCVSISDRWEELHEKAEELARLAELAPEKQVNSHDGFATRFDAATEWQQMMTLQAIDDIAAMLRPGLQAVHVVQSRGADASAAALALWREFYEARAALLVLLEPHEADASA